jgi:hypothetical protein
LILLNTPVVWLQWDEESRVLWIHILENTAWWILTSPCYATTRSNKRISRTHCLPSGSIHLILSTTLASKGNMLGKHCILWATPPSPFVFLFCFWDKVWLTFPRVALELVILHLSSIWDTGVHFHNWPYKQPF